MSDLPGLLKKYPAILKSLAYYTGFTQDQIMNLMQPGIGPKVVVTPNLVDSNNNPIYAEYDEVFKILRVNQSWVLGLEMTQLEETNEATGLLLGITTLHEFVHYGRDQNHLSYNWVDSNGAFHEAGWSFESDIDPTGAGKGIVSGNALKWVKFYPYNWK